MIRVLHYGMSPNLGGIETYLLNLGPDDRPATASISTSSTPTWRNCRSSRPSCLTASSMG